LSGIAGIIRFDGVPVGPDLVERMTDAMRFRGPDGIRHRVEGSVALGQCMLRTTPESLEEIQPLANEDGSLALVLDGRVDNRLGLRHELEVLGATLRDRSDAELVLRSYETWGRGFLSRIEGDFALVVWDGQARTVICARDRMGNRPLHYHWQPGVLSFASDLCALLALPWVGRDVNEGFLAEVLADEWHSRDETLWTGIHRLVAAHRMVVGAGGTQVERYWEPDLRAALRFTRESDVVDLYRETLAEEVRRCARSQAPVAFEVSGGLDSSALFCLAAHLEDTEGPLSPGLQGYTLRIDDGSPADELEYARAAGRFVGRPLHEVPPSRMPPEWFSERAAAFRDFPGYLNGTMFLDLKLLARSNGCRVVVTGEGGDQWLGGERTYYAETLRAGDWLRFLRLLALDARSRGGRQALSWALRQGLFPLLPRSVADVLRRAGTRFRRRAVGGGRCPWLTPRMNRLLESRRERARGALPPRPARVGQGRQLEVLNDPFGDHVMEVNERLNASLGLEGRNPFLSPAVVQLAFSVPEWMRRRGERNKHLHVSALDGLLPRLVLDRRSKADFASVARPQLDAREPAFAGELGETLQPWIEPDGLRSLFRTYQQEPHRGWPVWSLSAVLGWASVLRHEAPRTRE
jgi:asparagine synthase (glutamine-hydrolysing)